MTSKMAHYKTILLTAEETKKKYSLILDKFSVQPDTQIFALRVNLFKCVLSSTIEVQARVPDRGGKSFSHLQLSLLKTSQKY